MVLAKHSNTNLEAKQQTLVSSDNSIAQKASGNVTVSFHLFIKVNKRSIWDTFAERKTVPELGCNSPAINFSIVDFPMPFGPTT